MTSHRATLDDGAGGILKLGDSDSGAEDATLPRQRPQWTRIWRTTNSDGLPEFQASLPTHAVGKSNQVGCTINHLLDHDYNLHDALQTSPCSLCSTTSTSSLSGKDALVLMPTDGGKSLCYQLPELLLRGLVVVVSPLLALMQDQMAALRRKRIGVEILSSLVSKGQRERVVARLLQQYEAEPPADAECIGMLYTTPPTLQGEQMQSLLQHLERRGGLALFAVDEAHCISSWRHD
ncbi:unnamed protein product [Phytophthora fragariaefolia]|uniref:Unnamed protein product n=1 Tax=Phytophthora fragariaefolia TaxID=1490495 RepID=A0A9W6Y6W7_9STRA|nr:unnamed protein product [Phytophthora fragariaefolia]